MLRCPRRCHCCRLSGLRRACRPCWRLRKLWRRWRRCTLGGRRCGPGACSLTTRGICGGIPSLCCRWLCVLLPLVWRCEAWGRGSWPAGCRGLEALIFGLRRGLGALARLHHRGDRTENRARPSPGLRFALRVMWGKIKTAKCPGYSPNWCPESSCWECCARQNANKCLLALPSPSDSQHVGLQASGGGQWRAPEMAPAAGGRDGAPGGRLSEWDPAQLEETQSYGCLGAHFGAHPLLTLLLAAPWRFCPCCSAAASLTLLKMMQAVVSQYQEAATEAGDADDSSNGGGGAAGEEPAAVLLKPDPPADLEKRCAGTQGTWCKDFFMQTPIPAKPPPRYNKTCLWGCNFVGVCDQQAGWCRCPAGWTGDDCSTRQRVGMPPRRSVADMPGHVLGLREGVLWCAASLHALGCFPRPDQLPLACCAACVCPPAAPLRPERAGLWLRAKLPAQRPLQAPRPELALCSAVRRRHW